MIDVSPPRTVNVQFNGRWVEGAELIAWRYGLTGWLGCVRFRDAAGAEVVDWLPADGIRTDPYRSDVSSLASASARHRRLA